MTKKERPLPKYVLRDTLKRIIRAKGMTAPDVAKAAGVDRKSLNNMLNARYDPRPEKVDAVAQVFGMRGWQLLRGMLPDDITGVESAEHLLDLYYNATPEQRSTIMGVAEMATKYTSNGDS